MFTRSISKVVARCLVSASARATRLRVRQIKEAQRAIGE
jgi:hypothetical protein